MHDFKLVLTAHPEEADLFAITLDGNVLISALTLDEAMSYANGFTDGWRRLMANIPALHGPSIDWLAVREVEAKIKEAGNA